jgi:hypothetical protein
MWFEWPGTPGAGRQAPAGPPEEIANLRLEESTYTTPGLEERVASMLRGNETARRLGIARSAASINLVAQNGKSNRKIDFLQGNA